MLPRLGSLQAYVRKTPWNASLATGVTQMECDFSPTSQEALGLFRASSLPAGAHPES